MRVNLHQRAWPRRRDPKAFAFDSGFKKFAVQVQTIPVLRALVGPSVRRVVRVDSPKLFYPLISACACMRSTWKVSQLIVLMTRIVKQAFALSDASGWETAT